MRYFIATFLFCVFWANPAFAGFFESLIGAIAAGLGAVAVAYFTGATLGIGYFAYFALTAGVTLALGYVATALAPKQNIRSQQGYRVAGVAPAADRAVIYGSTRVGGVVVYKESTSYKGKANLFLHQIICLAGHECEDVTSIYFDDEQYLINHHFYPKGRRAEHLFSTTHQVDLSLTYVGDLKKEDQIYNYGALYQQQSLAVTAYFGQEDQPPCYEMIEYSDGKWTSRHRLRGICYVYLRMKFEQKRFPHGEPAISFEVKGKKLYDPRNGRTEHSDNPALVLRDYIHGQYGLDDNSTDDESFARAADVCDELVLGSDGRRRKRYTCNGAFLVGGTVKDAMDDILLTMVGTVWYTQGLWRVKAGKYTPPVAEFNEDDMRSTLRVVTKHSRRDSFNYVRGLYKGPETNFESTDFPPVSSQHYIDEDAGITSSISLDFAFVDNQDACQRIAAIVLRRNREQLTIKALFGIGALKVQVGDNLQITSKRLGWERKEFEVNDWKLKSDKGGNLAVEMELREISAYIFESIFPRLNPQTDRNISNNNTRLQSPRFVSPVGVSVSTGTRIINEHLVNFISIKTTLNQPELIDLVEVKYRNVDDADGVFHPLGAAEPGISEIIDPPIGIYDISAQAVNRLGARGPTKVVRNVRVEADSMPPETVTGFSYSLLDSGLFFEWKPVADLDLSFYRIRRSDALEDASYSNAVTVAEKVARPSTSIVLPAIPGTYMVKAFDKSGNQSPSAAKIIISSDDLLEFSESREATENPNFTGLKNGVLVSNGALRITELAPADGSLPQGTYDFRTLGVIDLGQRRRARVEMEIGVRRFQEGNSFDDLLGNFNRLAGTFDELSDLTEHDDINVVAYVSVNNGARSSSTGWTDYKRFTSGDFYARSFRFRVVLSSAMRGSTPLIDKLVAKVNYEV